MGITKERPLQSGKGGQNRTEGEQTGPEIDEDENQKVPPQLNKRDTIHRWVCCLFLACAHMD